MRSVKSIAAEIVRREGGYVNDPDDPGGATKHGVTLGTLRGLGLDPVTLARSSDQFSRRSTRSEPVDETSSKSPESSAGR